MNLQKKHLQNFFALIYIAAMTLGAFNGGSYAALGLGCGILSFTALYILHRRCPSIDRSLAGFAAVMLGAIALLNLQSCDPATSWHSFGLELTIMLPLLLLFCPETTEAASTDRLFKYTIAAAAIAAAALALELYLQAPVLRSFRGHLAPLTRYNRGASYIAVMAIPLLGYLWTRRQRWQALIFAGIMLLPFGLTESRATKVAFIFALITCAAAICLPRLTRGALVGFLITTLAMPFVVPQIFLRHHEWLNHLPPSWFNRVEIWDYMSYRIFERPWLGWGMGTSHLLPYADPHGSSYIYITENAGHPHNVILQLWVELGLPGLMAGLGFALLMLKKASAFPKPVMPFAYGTWIAAFCISLVSYNFWDDSLFAMFALSALALKMLAYIVENGHKTDLKLPE